MAFTYDVTTDRGKVRALVSDTSSTSCALEDNEVDAFLTLSRSNVFDAAALGCDAIRASFKKMANLQLFGEVSINLTELRRDLQALAKEYREIARMDAEMRAVQLQQKIDLYGLDWTDCNNATAVTSDSFTDYSQDDWDSL